MKYAIIVDCERMREARSVAAVLGRKNGNEETDVTHQVGGVHTRTRRAQMNEIYSHAPHDRRWDYNRRTAVNRRRSDTAKYNH